MPHSLIGIYAIQLTTRVISINRGRGWVSRLCTLIGGLAGAYLIWQGVLLIIAGKLLMGFGVAGVAFITTIME